VSGQLLTALKKGYPHNLQLLDFGNNLQSLLLFFFLGGGGGGGGGGTRGWFNFFF